MGKWPDFEYHGGKWIKYDRSSFNSSKATLGFCRRGSSENNKKLQCVKVKMEQGLVSPKRFRPDWASCSMADTWVTVWGSHSVIKKRFEIPLLTLAPPGGVEVRYTITFMSYTAPQNLKNQPNLDFNEKHVKRLFPKFFYQQIPLVTKSLFLFYHKKSLVVCSLWNENNPFPLNH